MRGNQWTTHSDEDRFWAKVDRRGPDECWPYLEGLSDKGYGRLGVKVNGKWRTTKAHRFAYELSVGPVPAGKVLDHTCHDPDRCAGGNTCTHRACCNPNHLSPVPKGENNTAIRMVSPGKSITHCPQGHEYTEENTIRERNQGYLKRICRTCRNKQARDRRAAKKGVTA